MSRDRRRRRPSTCATPSTTEDVTPSTLRGYRSAIEAHLRPAFGALPVEDVTTAGIEQWLAGCAWSVRRRSKLLIELHGILGCARRVYGLPGNTAADVEKFSQRPSGEIEVFSPEEVWALVRAAASVQDGAIFLTAESSVRTSTAQRCAGVTRRRCLERAYARWAFTTSATRSEPG